MSRILNIVWLYAFGLLNVFVGIVQVRALLLGDRSVTVLLLIPFNLCVAAVCFHIATRLLRQARP